LTPGAGREKLCSTQERGAFLAEITVRMPRETGNGKRQIAIVFAA